MRVRRATAWAAVALSAAALGWIVSATRVSGQPGARVVDMDGSLVLVSDGRVYARRLAALDDDVSWNLVTTIPAESPVAIRHLTDAPNHYFLVVTDDGEVFRYDGLNRRVERTGNIFGLAPAQRVRSKTIGNEPIGTTRKGR